MKRNIFFILIVFYSQVQAQHEAGISLGSTLFSGDVNSRFAFRETKPALGVLYKFYYLKYMAIKASFIYGGVKGSDAQDESYNPREIRSKIRNLSFKSNIWEIALSNEFHFVKKGKVKKWSPYILGGMGLVHFNPTAELNGKTYHLRDYHTEGQGLPGYKKEYKLTALTGIFGLGSRYMITPKFFLGIEFGYRFTNTDYMDDVSGNYADPSDLYNNYGITSVLLSDRSYEAYLDDPFYSDPSQANNFPVYYDAQNNPHIQGYGAAGDKRGNRNKDSYMIINLTASLMLGSGK
jgi:hypothetical protein